MSPAAAAAPGWTKKFSRHTSSAPTTPNGKYGPPDGVASTLPVGQGLAAVSLLGHPPEPPPPPAQPPRLYAQVGKIALLWENLLILLMSLRCYRGSMCQCGALECPSFCGSPEST